MDAAGLGWQQVRRASPQGRRLGLPLLLSLLIHALLLSLTFSGQEFGLPGFGFPWQDRRIEVPDLHVMLAPAPVTDQKPAITSAPLPLPPVSIEQTVATGPAVVTFRSTQQPPARTARATVSRSTPKAKATPRPKPKAATGTAPAKALADLVPAPKSLPTVIALEESKEAEFVVPPTPLEPATAVSAAPEDAGGAAQSRIVHPAREQATEEGARAESAQQEAARLEAARQEVVRAESAQLEAERQENVRQAAARQELALQEAARAESMQLEAERQENARQAAARKELARQEAVRAESVQREAERQENARQAAARKELARQEAARAESARLEADHQENARQAAARQEAARQEAARAESARLEAERQENARQAATRQELARQEASRQEAARAESARLESERQENARQAAARQEASRQAAARQEASRQEAARAESARLEAIREQDARRDAVRRAMGQQLDEEAARREAAQEATRRSPSASTLRRGRLFGRSDPNGELIQYAEAWSQKIHFNTAIDMVRAAAKQPHTDPMVTVAIRSDGSVESVTFVRSSGVAAIDDAIRRIVYNQTPYLPFQPALARDFDVIEIRRTWHLDTAIRLY